MVNQYCKHILDDKEISFTYLFIAQFNLSLHIQSLYFFKTIKSGFRDITTTNVTYNNVLEVAVLQLAKAMCEIKLDIFFRALMFHLLVLSLLVRNSCLVPNPRYLAAFNLFRAT